MAENKTKPTDVPVKAFVAGLAPESRKAEAEVLIAMLREATGEAPRMWGPSIIGFGVSRYAYESGRTGETPVVSFSPRKAALVLYVGKCMPDVAPLLQKLGKHTTGKACLYVKKLADIDLEMLSGIIEAEVAAVRSDSKS